MSISTDLRMRFLLDCSGMEKGLVKILADNPQIIDVWVNFDEFGKLDFKANYKALIDSYHIQPWLVNHEYDKIAKYYGSSISPSFEHPDLPGIRYVTADLEVSCLIDANKIANDSSQIDIIVEKFGYPEYIVKRAKDHYWKNEVFMLHPDGSFQIGRFSKESEAVKEWNNAVNKPLVGEGALTELEIETFKGILLHEYCESIFMELGVKFRSFVEIGNLRPTDFGSHDLAPLVSKLRWADLGRGEVPKLSYFDDSNLEEAINYNINFYRFKDYEH